jgi:hypothetical protein
MAFKKDAPRSRFTNWVWAWQDALFGAMILASVGGLIYAFIHK